MFIKFNVISFTDTLTGIVYSKKIWVHSSDIDFIEEYSVGACKIQFFVSSSAKWYCSDSYTGDELIELLNVEEKSNL